MPFASPGFPSIALAQLSSVVNRAHGARVAVKTHYFNQAFSAYLRDGGLTDERDFSLESGFNGLGDWMFRQAAFPDAEENSRRYFNRYYPRTDPQSIRFKERILARREGIIAFLNGLIEEHHLDQADLVGFTSMFSQTVASLALARLLKERRPEIRVVMGGANCEAPMGPALVKYATQLDHVFSGPGLVSFPKYVGRILEGNVALCDSIPGVLSRARGDVSTGDSFGEELDISEPVPLDYDPYFESLAHHFPEFERAPVFFETSRGCWWGQRAHCTFCGLNGTTMAYRAMEASQAIRQFETLFERYRNRASYFFGVDAIMPQNYVRDVFPHIQAPSDAPVFYEVIAGLSDTDLRVLSQHGVRRIQPGLESFSSSTLKALRKGTTPLRNIEQLIHSKQLGIQVSWNLLFGFPNEAEDSYDVHASLIPRLTHLEPPTGAYVMRFDRYSPFFNDAKQFGLELEPHGFYALTFPFPAEALRRLAYFFEDHNYAAPYRATLSTRFQAIRRLVEGWRNRWLPNGASPPPVLELRNESMRNGSVRNGSVRNGSVRNGSTRNGTNGPVVFDTRGDTPKEHDIGTVGLRVLAALGTSRYVNDLERELSDVSAREVQASLQALESAGLLYSEKGRYLSLVLPNEGGATDAHFDATLQRTASTSSVVDGFET